MAKNYRIAVIAGDGIGREVMPEGIAAMEAAARAYGFGFAWNDFDWSCETLHQDRPDDAGGRARAAAPLRRCLSRAPSAIPMCRTTSRCGAC